MSQIVAKKINKVEAGHILYVTGLLFEINRTVLHPVGLSLTWSADEGIGILDFTAMPDKAVFSDMDYKRGHVKFMNFLKDKGKVAMKTRKRILGFITQREGNIGKKSNG